MAYLFDTDAISELLRRHPLPGYVAWLHTIPREAQFTSAVVIGELYKGAYRSHVREHHLAQIERHILPVITVLPYDVATAKVFGQIRAHLEETGMILMDADIQIAATAVYHALELVTGNLQHFARIPELQLHRILADARASQSSPRPES